MLVFASSIDIWSLFLVGVLFLNSVKNTVHILHMLSAALLLSLGCCLCGPSFVHVGEHGIMCIASKCL